MAKIDLNIVDRGTQGNSWVADNTSISAEKLSEVVEQRTDNSGALNSLPTPFARFYVTKEAFRRAADEVRNSKNQAGYAYNQIVSDCLDVIELLFNYKFHKNSWKDEKLVIKEWDRKEKMQDLKESVPTLYNSLNTYFNSDLKEDKLYFVIYEEDGKEYLLGCSSPMTLFVTPPDMDKQALKSKGVTTFKFEREKYDRLHIVSKSGREYFRSIKMFGERDKDFKNYVFNTLFGGSGIDTRFKEIQDYIKLFKDDPDIRTDYEVDVEPVKTEYQEELVINGIHIGSDKAVDVNSFFTDSIIKLPYRLSDDVNNFTHIKGEMNRDFDFLMPFKPLALQFFDGVPDSTCHIKNGSDVVVTLRYKGKEYTREYEADGIGTSGKIYDLGSAKQNFDIGLFPNILSCEDNENNYFKLLVAITDQDEEAPQLKIDKVQLTFYKKVGGKMRTIGEEQPNQQYDYGVRQPKVRTRLNNSQDREYVKYESKFYELFDTAFDAIELNLLGQKALIMPKWHKSARSTTRFKYAIDLGTSNTFIARTEIDKNNLPQLFNVDHPMVSYMHAESTNDQLSVASRIEDSIFEEGRKSFVTEFVPPIVEGKKYKFPIRTALCHVKGNTERPSLFDNHNIAFFYEKELETPKQEILTDVKWEDNEERLRIFVRELLLMIKADVLQRNGDLDCTEIVWFRPLTFPANISSMYEEVWEEEPKKILDVDKDKVQCYTESEAPYYFFKKKGIIPNSEAVTVIDIGGGSTDFVYFVENKPTVANSVHFGCDVLWENGTAEFSDLRENGIYQRYANTIQFESAHLEEINVGLENDKNATTRDIINFWLDNSKDCNVARNLSTDFKPVFVYHFTSILFYIANMYKDMNLEYPKTIIFSGNGSRYIDNFISNKDSVLKDIIDLVFSKVFNVSTDIHLRLPEERKESTCYGGLYREIDDKDADDRVYQGDRAEEYKNVGEILNGYEAMKPVLMKRYGEMIEIYQEVLSKLKHDRILDNSVNAAAYVNAASSGMEELLNTNFVKEVKEKYTPEDIYYGSVFFLPIIDKVYQLTKI